MHNGSESQSPCETNRSIVQHRNSPSTKSIRQKLLFTGSDLACRESLILPNILDSDLL